MKYLYDYPNSELWYNEKWEDHISWINGLAQWMGTNQEINRDPYTGRMFEGVESDPHYKAKTKYYEDPEIYAYWASRGVRMSVLSQAGRYWCCMCPEKLAAEHSARIPALCVFHQEHIDPYWASRTVEKYRRYAELVAEHGDFMVVFLVSEGPDFDRIYLNIMQEAFVLFPADLTKIWLDVSLPLSRGVKLAEIPDFYYFDEVTMEPADPDTHIEYLEGIPYINVGNRWGNRDSLTRGLVMNMARNEGTCDRQRLIHSVSGENFGLGIALEWKYNTVYDPELLKEWERMGLTFAAHEKNGERWLSFVPAGAEAGDRLPVIAALQEVYPGNEHLAVTSLGYFYELIRIAAQGECVLIFFVLEDPKSNDLLADILAEAFETMPIDRERVYTIGHSHDGGFTKIFSYAHPELVTAIATLGNGMTFTTEAETGNPIGSVDDELAASYAAFDMPFINMVGEKETPFPADRSEKLEIYYRQYCRRLSASRCRIPTYEEFADRILVSGSKAEKASHVMGDREEVLWLDGAENYIIDIKNSEGKYWLRSVVHENMPHTTNPVMLKLAWSFLRRFARDTETKKIRELY